MDSLVRAGALAHGPAQDHARLPGPLAAGLPVCNRCGFEVTLRAWGCKHPCSNCGTVYPLGDCSD